MEGVLYYYCVTSSTHVAHKGEPPEADDERFLTFTTTSPPGSSGFVLAVDYGLGEHGFIEWFEDSERDVGNARALKIINAGGWSVFSHNMLTLDE